MALSETVANYEPMSKSIIGELLNDHKQSAFKSEQQLEAFVYLDKKA